MTLKRYSFNRCDGTGYECDAEMKEEPDGDYCLVQDIINELRKWMDCCNTLPEQQLAYKNFLKHIEDNRHNG